MKSGKLDAFGYKTATARALGELRSLLLYQMQFVFPMNGEAKQTKKLQFGAEKQGEWVTCAQKTPKSPKGFRRAFLRPGDGAGSQGV